MNYREWSEFYLLYYVQPTSKTRTYEHYSYLLQNHVVPYIGDKELDEITPLDLQATFTELLSSGNRKTGQGLAASTVNTIITVVQSSFKAAKMAGEIILDPASEIRRPVPKHKQVESFSNDEQKRIEYTVLHSKPKMLGVIICLYTGLRIGELLALEWEDVDFFNNTIHITKSCRDGTRDSGRIIDTPKTPKSRRTIPVPAPILRLLHIMRRKSISRYVISYKGGPVSVRSYQRSFQILLKQAGVPHKGFHALRHTFATRAAECGIDAKTIAEIMGHKNSNITLNLYIHSMAAHKTEMMDRVGTLFTLDTTVLRRK